MIKKFLIIALLPSATISETNGLSFGAGYSRQPTAAFESLSSEFFGDATQTTSISPFENSLKSKDLTANQTIDYRFEIPGFRLSYDTSLFEYFDKTALALELNRIRFPKGIGIFTEPGHMSTLSFGVDFQKTLIEITPNISFGAGGNVIHTRANYKSPLLDINSSYDDTAAYIFARLDKLFGLANTSVSANIYDSRDIELYVSFNAN